MKKLFLFLFIFLFLINFSSAFLEKVVENPDLKIELLNSGKISLSANYYPAISIVDNWDLPLISKEKASLVLTSHDASCGIDCMSEFQIATYTDSALVDDVKFFTLIDDGIVLDEPREQAIRSYQFQYYGDIENYTTQCEILTDAKNGSKYTHCVQIKVGSYKGWIDYNVGDVLPAGTYDVKLLGEKRPTRSVDWIIKTQGKTIDEWATWGNISTGSQAEVILNSPTDGSTQYIRNVSTTATANITGGAYLVNATLFDNSTGSWGARNSTNCLTSSYSDNIVSIQAWSDLGSKTEKMGMKFTTLYATTLINVTKYSSHAATKAYLWDASKNQIGSAVSFSGDVAVFPNILLNASTTYYIVTDNSGVGYTAYGTSGETYPKVATLINYTSSYFGGGDDTNRWIAFSKITMNKSDIVKNKTQTFTNTYPVGSNILWNYKFCDSDGACGFATSNYTFSIDSSAPTITLNYPTSLIDYGAVNGTLQLNLTATDTNLDSVWYDYNGTNITISATSGVASLSNITLSDKKNITIYANDTAGNSNSSFFSWDYQLTENNRTYSATTLSGNINTFAINAYINSTAYPNAYAYLNYNNTNYSSVISSSGDNYVFTTSLQAPSVTNNTNMSFYWIFVLTDTLSNSYTISTSSSIQTIEPLLLGNCSSYGYALINYTILDETTENSVVGNISTNVLIYSSDTLTLIANYSNQFVGVNNATVCINNSLSGSAYSLYTETTYWATGYSTRHNYIQNYSLGSTTIPQNTSLYLLPSSASTTFQMNFKGTTLSGISGVLLNIQRQYTGQSGVYKTVEIEKTDTYGQAIGYFDLLNNGIYSITATYNGQVIGLFPSISLYCITGQSCAINLYAAPSGATLVDVNNLYNTAYYASFNQTTRTVTVNFNTLDSSVSDFRLYVTTDDAIPPTICNTSVSTSAGALTCYVPLSYGNNTVVAYFFKDGVEIAPWTWSFDISNVLGGNTVVILIIMFLTLITLFIPDIRWVLLMDGVGFILSFSLFAMGESMIGVITSSIWIVIVVAILIYKYRSRE